VGRIAVQGKKIMNFSFHAMLAVFLGATAVALADVEAVSQTDATTNNNEGQAQRRWAKANDRAAGAQIGGRLIDRLMENTKLTAEIGLSKDTVARLRDETLAIQTQQQDLDAQIRKLSLEQANRMSKLLLSSDANTSEVMKAVEEIGHLRTEQAKLTVQNLIVVRKYLTPEQIRKARELMREQAQNKDGENRPSKKGTPATTASPAPAKPPEGW